MSTFEQNIANLRQNNRLVTQQIKTYNADEARFESARLQKQAELLVLAGQLGANLVEKIAANRKKDRENEWIIDSWETEAEAWQQSEDAKLAEEAFKLNAANQNKMSDVGIEVEEKTGGELSDIKSEFQQKTGKLPRIAELNFLHNRKERYGAWVNSELLNNTDIFFATIDGQTVKLQVNDPNLTYKQKVAAHNYLTREYLKLHDIQRYSREFLFLPTERGGSGFMKGIMESRQAALEELKTAYKIELSEFEIVEATKQFANLKTSQSFNDLLTSVKAGYDSKGKPLNYAGAWKRLNDKILPQMIDAEKLGPDDILSIGQNTTLTIDGKEKKLGEHRFLEWGEGGKWHRKAMEVWKNRGEREQAKADFALEDAAEKFIENFNNDTFTSESDLQLARSALEELNAEGTGDFDFSEIDALMDSKLTKEQANNRASEILKTYNESTEGLKLSELIKSEDIRVKKSSILTKALKDEDKFYKELENSLKGEKKNYASEAKDVNGLSVWEYNNPSAEEKWHLIEGYAIRLKRDNPTVRNSQIWKETQAWIKDNEAKINFPYDQWDEEAKLLEGKELEEFNEKRSKLFVEDNLGYFPNMLPEIEFKGPSTISKEDKKELKAVTTIDPLFGNEVTTWVKRDPEAKFTNTNLIIPEEKAVFQNREIDYNKMLDDIGYIPDKLVDLAAAEGLTTAEFINYRQTANGKKELKPEYAKFLNEKEVSTLPSAMRKRLLGNINDGQYTSEHIPATITQYSNLSSASLINTFQEHGEQFVQGIATNYETFASSLDEDGEWIDNAESGKALIGFYSGIAMSLDPKVFNDFQPGGADLFIEAVKTNLNEEAISSMVMSPDFGFNAYTTSGDIDYLPVVDSLQATKGQDNLNKIMQKLAKIWQTETPEDEISISETFGSDQNLEISGTDIIDESLNTDN